MAPANTPDTGVALLIDRLLSEKDPATVGLRRILRNKQEESATYQYRPLAARELDVPGKTRIFTDQERHLMELEKEMLLLRGRFDEAQERARTAVKAAYEQGYRAGVSAGVEKGRLEASAAERERFAELQAKTGRVIQTVLDEKRQMLIHAEGVLVRLAMALARKIVHAELTANPDFVLGTVKKALAYVAARERMVIRVSPRDFAAVNEKREFWQPVNERLKEIVIEQDERIERGGCVVESNAGTVDARLGVQFDELDKVIETVGERRGAPQADDQPPPPVA